MGKRGGSRKVANSAIWSSNSISLREETTGKKQQKRGRGGSSSNAKHLLKVEHLEKLAIWASWEASIPSLAKDWPLLGSLWVFLLTLLSFHAGCLFCFPTFLH
ncbi:hypothetical protein TorRG33x02_009150 [Trema orientale]|uniref:Transmembrane protein n=1 Tax=Trema orientale TaxID=63057 RepID=A0A2P5FYL0_TREOI|nr:hypothetical protein TorRG33x02_009150 [Trema orientale]